MSSPAAIDIESEVAIAGAPLQVLGEDTRRPLFDLTKEELIAWLAERGQPRYRARQVWQAVTQRRAGDLASLKPLPKGLQADLAAAFTLDAGRVLHHAVSRDGTEKLLLELTDGETLETVLMREDDRRTVCVSSQVGCAMGCVFCASGLLGVKRNLSAGEMLAQVLLADRLLPPGERLTNVVVMGLGEPMANLRNLRRFLDVLTDADGFAMSPRRITVSTVGLPKPMRQFADWARPYNLAVSLHAPREDLRSEIVPVNRSIGLDAVLEAAEYYFDQTGRRVTYEYVLLAGRNDTPREAEELARLLRGRRAHVNLIPMNPVAATGLEGTAASATQRFAAHLREAGIAVTVRKRKGADIDAACGQLRLAELQQAQPATESIKQPTEQSAPPSTTSPTT